MRTVDHGAIQVYDPGAWFRFKSCNDPLRMRDLILAWGEGRVDNPNLVRMNGELA